MSKVALVTGAIARATPPTLDDGGSRDWWSLLRASRHVRKLGRRDTARLARWVPMSIADFLDEWFETPLVQTAIAARAIFGNLAGPRSPGTTAAYLQRLGEDGSPTGGGVTARGGPGAVTQAIATQAARAGVEIRTGARVSRILVRDGRVSGVALDTGDEIHATSVVAAIDPKRALLDLVDPGDLPASIRERAQHIRARGVTAKINLALSGPPHVPALDVDPLPLRGRLLIADDLAYLERAFDAAKYGEISGAPWLEVLVPTMSDGSLTVEGQHVMSIYAHFAPRELRGAAWSDRRDALYRAVMSVLEPHAPHLESLIVGRQILTPEDLERDLGASGGHIFHGETALDQSWLARPLLGWAQYRAPLPGLYFASAGTHPGGGLTGLSGLLAARAIERPRR
jgi:phytoene dehydrogenase-like protein